MRAVVDPGVLVSGLISRTGAPARILDLWDEAAFELVVSPGLLEELADVITRSKFVAIILPEAARDLLDQLRVRALLVDDPPAGRGLTADPKDDYLVSLARAIRADLIVSGDRHLTELPKPQPRVVTPRAFVDLLERI